MYQARVDPSANTGQGEGVQQGLVSGWGGAKARQRADTVAKTPAPAHHGQRSQMRRGAPTTGRNPHQGPHPPRPSPPSHPPTTAPPPHPPPSPPPPPHHTYLPVFIGARPVVRGQPNLQVRVPHIADGGGKAEDLVGAPPRVPPQAVLLHQRPRIGAVWGARQVEGGEEQVRHAHRQVKGGAGGGGGGGGKDGRRHCRRG